MSNTGVLENRHLSPAKRERRKEFRYPVADPVEIGGVPPFGNRVPAIVVNVSGAGLLLRSLMPIPSHSEIEVIFPTSKFVIFGEVRYCRESHGKFWQGLRIDDAVHLADYAKPHMHQHEIALYIWGKGLTAPEFLRVKAHIAKCEFCSRMMAEAAAVNRAGERSAPQNPPRDVDC